MRSGKFVISGKFNIKIQSLFQKCTATWHQTPSCRAFCVAPWSSWSYNFRRCRLRMIRIQLCNHSISSFFMCPPGGHVLKTPCMQLLKLTTEETVQRKFHHLLLGWAWWHLHRAGHHRVNQGRRAQHDTYWPGPSLFSLQPAWSRCYRQAGCSQWLLGIPLCSLLHRLHQWHRYGSALKTEVLL